MPFCASCGPNPQINPDGDSIGAFVLLPLHPSISFVPMRRGPRASRKPHRNPGPVSQTRIHTAMHSALNHTHDIAHCLIPPVVRRGIVCAMSSVSDALLPSGASAPSSLPDARSAQPTPALAVDARSVLQNRRTVRCHCRVPKTSNLASADINIPASCKFNYSNLT
jgi:hypothetical protein